MVWFRRMRVGCLGMVCLAFGMVPAGAKDVLKIDFWYGDAQTFGRLGNAQKWINVLGHVSPGESVASLSYSLNNGALRPLSFFADTKRIARLGDFNVELDRHELRAGKNDLTIRAISHDGNRNEKSISITTVNETRSWPMPYTIRWAEVEAITDVVQVVDGKWRLTSDGVRSVEPHYDRVLAFGDDSWTDYEVSTTVVVHSLTEPGVHPNDTGVTHAAIAMRWPGHDEDGKQPSVKWFPLGATAEIRLGGGLSRCRWRIFDGDRSTYVESKRRRSLEFERPYAMKHRVETRPDGDSHYRVKLWPANESEPEAWDLERFESDDLPSGSALLLAHHSEVTFGDVSVVSLRNRQD